MILLNDVQQKTKKGLARFGPDAQGAADSLQPLYVHGGGGEDRAAAGATARSACCTGGGE